MKFAAWVFGILLLMVCPCFAKVTHDYTFPLHDGHFEVSELNSALAAELHVPTVPTFAEIDVGSKDGREFADAVNACLWRGSRLRTFPDKIELRIEPLGNEGKVRALKRMTRLMVAEHSCAATVEQSKRWGLYIPNAVQADRAMVVLIHGLDGARTDCVPLAKLVQQSGFQVALFGYPGDQPISDSGAMFSTQMQSLRSQYPGMPIYVVAHSMGGLVARDYIEGPDYAGGVDKLIMVGTPNHGSTWAPYRIALSMQEHYYLREFEPAWRWTWFFTEGIGEAGTDLAPDSEYLHQLNVRPRRAGTHYTTIAGNRSDVDRVEADIADSVAAKVPKPTRRWWGISSQYNKMRTFAERHRTYLGDSDGPVTLKSTELKNVTDWVVLPADHRSLFFPTGDAPPAAWPIVRDRLSH